MEQARVEAIGSSEFKGIQKNLKNKYIRDLKIGNTKKDQNLLIKAFKNVAFEEIVGVDLGENNSSFKNIVKEKLKKDYSNFFIDLKKCLHDQEKYTSTIVEKLDELGLLNNRDGKDIIKCMVATADLSRSGFINGDISTVMSPRTVLTWAENYLLFNDIEYSFKLSFLNRCDEMERSILQEYFQRSFGIDIADAKVANVKE